MRLRLLLAVALPVPAMVGVLAPSFAAPRGPADDWFDGASATQPDADARTAAPGSPPDLTRFWLTGGAAIGAADSSQVHFTMSLGTTRYLLPRLALGVGGVLAPEYKDSGFWGSPVRRTVYALDACSEYAMWRGRSTRALATADLGVGWWRETRGVFGTSHGERGVHGAVGVAVVHRALEKRWGVVLHVAYHPDMGQDLWKPFVTISLGPNRQRW